MADYTQGFESVAEFNAITETDWSNPTGTVWTCTTSAPHSGTKCLRGGGSNNVVTTVQVTKTTGAGTLSFWWKVSSEATYDT